MKAFIVLSALFAVVACSGRLGEKKCMWGPAYWCSDVSHAVECGSVEHCVSRSWKDEIPPVTSSTASGCAECQNFVGEISHALKQSHDAGLAFLKYVCGLSASTYSQECRLLAGDNTEAFLSMLQNGYDAESVCKLFKRCAHPGGKNLAKPSASKRTKIVESLGPVLGPVQIPQQPKVSTACDTCERVFGFVYITLNNNQTKQQVHQMINQYVCSALGAYAAECQAAVNVLFDELYTKVVAELYPSKICSDLTFCNATAMLFKSFPKVSVANCQECTDTMSYIHTMLANSSVEAMIKNKALSYCDTLGTFESGFCKSAVDSKFDGVYSEALTTLTAKFVCAQIHLCPSAKLTSCRKPAPVTLALTSSAWKEGTEKLNGESCTMCESVVSYARSLLEQKATKAEVKKFILGELCGALGDLGKECDALVNQYFDMIYQMLDEAVDPQAICGYLNLCTGLKSSRKLKDDVPCDLCMTLDSYAYTALKDPKTQAAVKSAIESYVCASLGNSSAACVQKVEMYFPIAMDFLLPQLANGTQLCESINMCPPTCKPSEKSGQLAAGRHLKSMRMLRPAVSAVSKPQNVKTSVECVVCEFVMSKLVGLLGNNKSEAAIEAALEKVCSLLPKSVSAECDELVKSYTPMIIKIILEVGDPALVCARIGVCASVTNTRDINGVLGVKGSDGECAICEGVASELKAELTKQKGTEKQLLLDVCGYLGGQFKTECNALVDQYGDAVIEMLISAIDPESVCKEIGLCTATYKSGRFVPDGRLHIMKGIH